MTTVAPQQLDNARDSRLPPRTLALLEAPITSMLLRMAAPNLLHAVAMAVIITFDGFLIGRLGPEELAGVSLVFPVVILMHQVAAGGMGVGVAAAVARALGSNDRQQTQALVFHALLIAAGMAAIFTFALLAAGNALYRTMGGTGATLDAALAYSKVVFSGALSVWLLNTLASILRGAGNMTLPAVVMVLTAVAHVAISAPFIFGWGFFPRLGVAGAGVGLVASFTLGSLFLLAHLLRSGNPLRPSCDQTALRRALFWEILRVGAPGALGMLLTNLRVMIVTGLVGSFGVMALAGFGMAVRLEYILIPLVFGLGTALVTMVGANIGAGQVVRANRAAWTGAGIAFAVTGGIGVLVALFPHAWIGLFTADPEVLVTGVSYLRIVGPFSGFLGLGGALAFACQGAGHSLLWPLMSNIIRFVISVAGGWAVLQVYGGISALFVVIAFALVAYGGTMLIAVTITGSVHRPDKAANG